MPHSCGSRCWYWWALGTRPAMSSIAGLALVAVLLGSVVVGVYMVLYDRAQWDGMAKRVRRFVHRHDRGNRGK
jgi:hypothetical protein